MRNYSRPLFVSHAPGSFIQVSFLASTVAPTPSSKSADRSAHTPSRSVLRSVTAICVPQSEMSDLYASRRCRAKAYPA